MIYNAASLNEAIALANRFRAEGKYDLFRGQKQNWPLRSSLQRLREAERYQAMEWFARFRSWLSNKHGFWAIAADSDQTTAVAQHYGLPTDFIDFTSDPLVAGFFATDRRAAQEQSPCCILCLNSEDLFEFWKNHFDNYRRPDIVRITVANLWRLETQKGAFLFCPHSDFDAIYALDRILFSCSPSTELPPLEKVYPPQESELERTLQDYFQKREIYLFNRYNEEELKIPVIHMETPDQGYRGSCLKKGSLDRLASWDEDNLMKWRTPAKETYENTVKATLIRLNVPEAASLERVSEQVAGVLRCHLTDDISLRQQSVNFIVEVADLQPEKLVPTELPTALRRLWDGVRRLPFSDEEIANGCGNCVAFALAKVINTAQAVQFANWKNPFLAVLKDAVEVEFQQHDGSYSRGFVSEAALRQIIRIDFYDLLKDENKKDFVEDIRALLYHIYAPDRLFDFRGLSSLFAKEIAPSQVLYRGGRGNTIIYSPAHLETFGLP